MIHEKSCGAIVFRQSGAEVTYLLLKHRNGLHWGFPKGHVEAGESEAETALREIYEEAGLRVQLREGFRAAVEYAPSQGAWKEVVYFLGEASDIEVKHQEEEIGDYCWAEYETAGKLLDHENNRGLLREAHHFLMSQTGGEKAEWAPEHQDVGIKIKRPAIGGQTPENLDSPPGNPHVPPARQSGESDGP